MSYEIVSEAVGINDPRRVEGYSKHWLIARPTQT